jgi:hypothetical protein
MTSTQKLYESYFAVYDDELRETLTEETELFEDVSYLYDDELEEIVDETIEAMVEEGYELDDILEAFEDILSEATVTTGRGGYTKLSSDKRSAPVTTGQGTAMRQQARRSAVVSAARQRQAQAVKDAPGKAVGAVRKAVDTRVASYAAKHGLETSKKGKPINATAIQARQGAKDPSVRRGIRAKVVGHLAGRAAAKLQRGAEKVKSAVKQKAASAAVSGYAAGKMAKDKATAAGSAAAGAARKGASATAGAAKAVGSAAKGLLKKGVGKVARKVASGAGKLASRLGEDVDVYDVVLDHLLTEGYAETPEAAQAIMVNMSEEWISAILED